MVFGSSEAGPENLFPGSRIESTLKSAKVFYSCSYSPAFPSLFIMIKLLTQNLRQPRLEKSNNTGFLKKFTSVLSVDILVKASSFILLPVFLRLMSQEEFGLYNYLLSIVQTFALVFNFGLYVPQSKYYHSFASREEKGQLLFTICITLLLLLLLICLPMGLLRLDDHLVSHLFENNSVYHRYKGLLLVSLLITVFSFMLTNFFYTSEKVRQVKTYNVYRIVLVNAISLLALSMVPGSAVFIRLVFVNIAEGILFLLFAFYFFKELVPVFDKDLMRKCIRMGFPIMLSAVLGIVVNFSDKFLLQKYGSLTDLSNYYLAFSFASIIYLIFSSFQNVWLPRFLQEKNVEENFRKTKKLVSWLLLAFTIMGACIWILFVVLLWWGIVPARYEKVTGILPIMLLTQIAVTITAVYSNYMIYFEKTFIVSITGVIASIVSLGLGFSLVPRWGMYGAALSALAVNVLYLGMYYYLVLMLKKNKIKALPAAH
jgi:O-antigen/teichoic acid export membrane protein